jgi:hypothetical protein
VDAKAEVATPAAKPLTKLRREIIPFSNRVAVSFSAQRQAFGLQLWAGFHRLAPMLDP